MSIRPGFLRGFSLVELLVGMVAGLVVVAGTVGLVTAILASNNATIKASRLNQDLSAMMAIMVSDLRRAGYNAESGTAFLYDDASSLDAQEDATSGCLGYLYEHEEAGHQTLRNYAFRRANNVVLAHEVELDDLDDTDRLDCTTLAAGGDPLNDADEIEITAFGVDENSWCLNSDSDDIEADCDPAVVRVRQVTLSLQGRLATDHDVVSSVREIVRIRNNESL